MTGASSATANSAARPPSGARVGVMTLIAVFVAGLINFALVWLAKAFDPALNHYSHFRLSDYGTLTALGVLGAGFAWYGVTRILADPRRAFFRAALGVTVFLWLPDLWLLLRHEPTRAVLFLAIMHAVVALVTYNLLVVVAPLQSAASAPNADASSGQSPLVLSHDHATPPVRRLVWVSLMVGVVVDFVAGMIGMLYVPFNRPNGWLTHRGEAIYLVHAALGALLAVGALALLLHVLRGAFRNRIERLAAMSGLAGVVIGALGGFLCVLHSLRLTGLAVMFLGGAVAFFGYLIPLIDRSALASNDELIAP